MSQTIPGRGKVLLYKYCGLNKYILQATTQDTRGVLTSSLGTFSFVAKVLYS